MPNALWPAQIEDLLTGLDHGAIDDADDDRRHLARGDGDHHLVEQRHSLRDLSQPDHNGTPAEPAERHEVRVAEVVGDGGSLVKRRVRGRVVAVVHMLEGGGHEQIAPLHAVLVVVVEQALGTGEPAAAARHLALAEEREAQPERAACGPRNVAKAQVRVMRLRQGVGAVTVPAEQLGGHREPFEVLRPERRLTRRG
jgi:hypothetical protein